MENKFVFSTMRIYKIIIFLAILFYILGACKKESVTVEPVASPEAPTVPTPYTLTVPTGFPPVSIPKDNPLTVEASL